MRVSGTRQRIRRKASAENRVSAKNTGKDDNASNTNAAHNTNTAAPTPKPATPTPTPVSASEDNALKNTVEANLTKAGITGVTVEVKDGVVTLKGSVPTAKFMDAVKAATDAKPKKVEVQSPQPPASSLLLQNPVRSGQRIVFAEGDVTVLGSVGSGAEIVASGSIHVYGTLRGRAMAGINGNSAARIYCQKIEAELLAIDGYYQTAEDIGEKLRRQPAQAWLDGDVLRITPLN